MGHNDLRTLAAALDGEVSGHQVLAPGPGHSRTDRSLSVRLTDVNADGFVVHSFAGDDPADCKDHVRDRLGLPRWEPAGPSRPPLALSAKPLSLAAPAAEDDGWTSVTPVPDDAFPLDVELGREPPKWTWIFRDAEGRALGVECRWIKPKGKEVRFATWCRHEDGRTSWRLKHLPAPRPLYGLDRLALRAESPVLLVEGAKKVKPAEKLFPDVVVTAWIGGGDGVRKADWRPLSGRRVVIWPDNDATGRKAAETVVELAHKAGAVSVAVVPVPKDFPLKWDLAEPPPKGADILALLDAAKPVDRPKPEKQAPAEQRYPAGFRMCDRGLVWSDPHDEDKADVVVSDRFEVLAESRDDAGQSWGVLLRWRDQDGRAHEWAMPRAMLAGDGTEIRRVLLEGGLYLGNGEGAKRRLLDFLAGVHVKARARAVSTTGWYGSAFVLPDGAIGQPNGEWAILQTSGGVDHAYNVRGTLEEWKANVARYAVGNSRLLLALSASFAAALVGPCGDESGGIHFRGPSSIGKTTALTIAGSAWGGGEQKYVRPWRATSNGLEAVATAHNDALLCLDELAQLGGREAGETAYMLANGSGKARAARDATARRPAKWRLLFLSSGEISLADKIAEDARGRRQTAGQAVRVVDVKADTGCFGLFEELHDFTNPSAFAKHIGTATSRFYGTAARAFVNAIAADLDGLRETVKAKVRTFVDDQCPDGADGQVCRVAARFGLIAAAGEIAATASVVPWPRGEATWAARTCFATWIEARGGVEAAEVTESLDAVRTFLSAHSSSRFLAAWEPGADQVRIVNLAGYRRREQPDKPLPPGEERPAFDFYVTPEAWKEVCAGFDPKAVLAIMLDRGFLKRPENGQHLGTKIRVPGHGLLRLYHIPARIMESDDV